MSRTLCRNLLLLGLCISGSDAIAQCAPGVPSAGNPGCIPPNQPNSPYYQNSAEPPAPQQVPVHWADSWGAIAFDTAHGHYGAVKDLNSRRDARNAAIEMCESQGGTDCKIALDYHNQCAAAAQNPSGGPIGTAGGPNRESARALALKSCGQNECEVIYTECSIARRID